MKRQVFGLTRSMVRTAGVRYGAIKPTSIMMSKLRTPSIWNSNTVRFYSEKKTDEANESEIDAEAEAEQNLSEDAKRIQELESKLLAKDKEAADLKDRLIRSIADFRNLQEVTKRDVQKAKDFALQKFAKDLLESVDNFGHALGAVKTETVEQHEEVATLYDGVKMTKDVFEKTLTRHGLEKIDPLGEVFDPNMHEATFELVQPDKEPGTVFLRSTTWLHIEQ
ncbi:unnamed protein product [Wickerhamomyces anomalus]